MTETETLRAALAVCVDAMRRCSEEFCAAHGVEHISDSAFDDALAVGEDALEVAS